MTYLWRITMFFVFFQNKTNILCIVCLLFQKSSSNISLFLFLYFCIFFFFFDIWEKQTWVLQLIRVSEISYSFQSLFIFISLWFIILNLMFFHYIKTKVSFFFEFIMFSNVIYLLLLLHSAILFLHLFKKLFLFFKLFYSFVLLFKCFLSITISLFNYFNISLPFLMFHHSSLYVFLLLLFSL